MILVFEIVKGALKELKMIGSEVCIEKGTRVISPLRDDQSGDEELAVLPRHTKVIVTGNNRTKSVLVGLHGVVKKAVGLGGWHWLVLKNGIEVKLQRNALSVLEPPTGNEVDDEIELSSSSSDLSEKEHEFASSLELQKVSKRRVRHTRLWGPSASAKSYKRNCFKEYQTCILKPPCSLDFTKLGSDSLSRYLTRFHLDTYYQPNISRSISSPRDGIVNLVQHHFLSQQVDEVQVIAEFVRAAKRLRSRSSSIGLD